MSVVTVDLAADAAPSLVIARAERPVAVRRTTGRLLASGLIVGGDVAAFGAAVLVSGAAPLDALRYGVALLVVLVAASTYRPRLNLVALPEAPAHVMSAGLTLLLLGLFDALLVEALGVGDGVSSATILMAGATALFIPLGRWASYCAVRSLRRRRIVRTPVLVIGADRVGTSLARTLETRAEHGLHPVGFVDDIDPAGAPAPLLGDLAALDDVITQQSVRQVIVAFGSQRDDDLVRVLRATLRRHVDVYVVPRLGQLGLDGASGRVETVDCIPLQRLRPAAPTRRAWRAKRIFDVSVAGTALVLAAPLLLALAVGIKLSGPGPVLFRQQRVGQYGRIFELLKFRSLHVNDDCDVRWSVAGDDRQTPIGRWMRRFSLDELPQLWNVVRGDMSLIGPRPERPHFVELFSDAVDGYEDRHRLPVGLTGWAQVNGLRGDTSIAERARFDNHYIDDWSLLGDLSILVATVAAIVRDGRRKRSA